MASCTWPQELAQVDQELGPAVGVTPGKPGQELALVIGQVDQELALVNPGARPAGDQELGPRAMVHATWCMMQCNDLVGRSLGVVRALAIVRRSMAQGSPGPMPGWHAACLGPGPRFSAPRRGFAGFSPISHRQSRPET